MLRGSDRLQLRESDPDHRVNYSGEYYKLINACLQARAVRKPRVPVYIAAGAPKTLELCATYGDGWIPIGGSGLSRSIPQLRQALADAGRNPDAFPVVPFGSVPDEGKFDHFANLGIDEVVVAIVDTTLDGSRRFLEETATFLERAGLR